MHADRLPLLRDDVALDLGDGPLLAAEHARETWRQLEEFNLNPSLALEALFVRIARDLRPARALAG